LVLQTLDNIHGVALGYITFQVDVGLYGIETLRDVCKEAVISMAGIVHEEVDLAIQAKVYRSFDELLDTRLRHDIGMDQDGFATGCLYILDDCCSSRTAFLRGVVHDDVGSTFSKFQCNAGSYPSCLIVKKGLLCLRGRSLTSMSL